MSNRYAIDPLFMDAGRSGRLGGQLLYGWFLPFVGHVLFGSAPDAEEIDEDLPVGTADEADGEIAAFAYLTWPVPADYRFAVAAVGICGCQSDLSNVLTVTLDEAGDPEHPPPNAPLDLAAEAANGHKVRVAWSYSDQGQAAAPSVFRVYRGTGRGGVLSQMGQIGAGRGSGRHDYLTASFAPGEQNSWYEFVVRAVSALGAEEQNDNRVPIYVDSQAPPALVMPLWREVTP